MKPRKRLFTATRQFGETAAKEIKPVSISRSSQHISPTQSVINPAQKKSARLHNLYTGRIMTVGHRAATFLATRYPEEYKLIA